MYKVLYLPTARRELEEAVLYIATELSAPDAAIALADAVDCVVEKLSDMPYRHSVHPSLFGLSHEVRFVPVKNYNVYYIVFEESKTVEIRRVIYRRRNTQEFN